MSDNKGLFGQVIMSWEVDEYPRYERSRTWYLAAVGIGIALLIYAVASANFLFALIIMMFGLIIYLSSVTEPRRVIFQITEDGVVLGDTLHPYGELRHFWFVYEPPDVKDLHFDFKNALRPRLTVNLEKTNPNRVREALGDYLLEDFTQDEEPMSDFIGRILKI